MFKSDIYKKEYEAFRAVCPELNYEFVNNFAQHIKCTFDIPTQHMSWGVVFLADERWSTGTPNRLFEIGHIEPFVVQTCLSASKNQINNLQEIINDLDLDWVL